MICNEKQRNIHRCQLLSLGTALESLPYLADRDWIHVAQRDALKRLIRELNDQLADYDQKRSKNDQCDQ